MRLEQCSPCRKVWIEIGLKKSTKNESLYETGAVFTLQKRLCWSSLCSSVCRNTPAGWFIISIIIIIVIIIISIIVIIIIAVIIIIIITEDFQDFSGKPWLKVGWKGNRDYTEAAAATLFIISLDHCHRQNSHHHHCQFSWNILSKSESEFSWMIMSEW